MDKFSAKKTKNCQKKRQHRGMLPPPTQGPPAQESRLGGMRNPAPCTHSTGRLYPVPCTLTDAPTLHLYPAPCTITLAGCVILHHHPAPCIITHHPDRMRLSPILHLHCRYRLLASTTYTTLYTTIYCRYRQDAPTLHHRPAPSPCTHTLTHRTGRMRYPHWRHLHCRYRQGCAYTAPCTHTLHPDA